MGKRVVVFGPPGVGKGTHSRRLAGELLIPRLCTGEIFRQAVQEESDFGRRIAHYMETGQFVPDDLVMEVMTDRLAGPEARSGYLLDGFPRTLHQAHAFHHRLVATQERVDAVLSLEAPADVLVARLAGRFTCPSCQASFNTVSKPPKVAGLCDVCQAALTQRPDDGAETVQARFRDYLAKTEPVLSFFQEAGWPVSHLSALGSVDEVYDRARSAVGA